jgi:hypothetical protein
VEALKTTGRPSSQLIESEIDGDISLYHPRTEQVVVLNGTASDVWRLCDGERSVEEVAALLASSYGLADAEGIIPEVSNTISQFAESGLFEEE